MSEVWVVERVSRGWDGPPTITIVREFDSQHNAEQYAHTADWGQDMGSSTWHRARKVTKTVSYH
jgi:hypothetical protein